MVAGQQTYRRLEANDNDAVAEQAVAVAGNCANAGRWIGDVQVP
jgi:hypothetical protein